MTWTHFWDMHSGGGQKEEWAHIYIEASEDEAKRIFYGRFGHNPDRVSCTCCGADYSIRTNESLAQLTGFHRGCRAIETPRDPVTGLYNNDDPVISRGIYLEEGEAPPDGYGLSCFGSWGTYQTLETYLSRRDVLIIKADDIKPEWRTIDVPEQGYIWIGDDDE